MKRHTCHPAGYDALGPARRIGQEDAAAHTGDDTPMTSASGPLYRIGGAQVTCPHCSAPMTCSPSEPPTTGGTVLTVVHCTSCPFVMVGADPALGVRTVEWERDEPGPFDVTDFRPDEHLALTIRRPLS